MTKTENVNKHAELLFDRFPELREESENFHYIYSILKNLFNQFATLTKADVKKVSEFALSHYKITKLENATSSQASALIKYMQEQIAKKQDDGQ